MASSRLTTARLRSRDFATASGGPFPFRGSFETEAADGGTRLTARFETEAPGVLRFADGLFTRLARRQLAASVANLRRLMEAGELQAGPTEGAGG